MKIPRIVEFTITVPLDEIGNNFNEMLDILHIESLAETRYLKNIINKLATMLHINYYHLLDYIYQIVIFEKSKKDKADLDTYLHIDKMVNDNESSS